MGQNALKKRFKLQHRIYSTSKFIVKEVFIYFPDSSTQLMSLVESQWSHMYIWF